MRVRLKESETLELKRSTSELKEALISLAAMLNKHGHGELYFGVRNSGKAIGQTITDKTLRDISQAISQHIEPKVFPKIRELTIEGKNCIHLEFSGENALYYAYGRARIRIGTEDRAMSAKELERFILKKNREILRWDNKPCRDATLSDISPSKIKPYLKKADLPYDSVRNALNKLELLTGEQPQNAAILLFGKKPERFFTNAKLRCALFATNDTLTPLDMQNYAGDVFSLIEKAEQYILQNIHVGMRLEGLYRIDVPEINRDAVREAIINAFCHRNWWNPDPIAIAIFKDRVEVRSPGLLYGGLTIKRITTEMVSERRNKLLADLFQRILLMEQWGRGIKLILSKAPGTRFKEVGTHFIVVFKRAEHVPENVPENVPEKRPGRILRLMKDNPRITVPVLAKRLGVAEKTVKRDIKKLKAKGMLKRVGPDKGGHWVIDKH